MLNETHLSQDLRSQLVKAYYHVTFGKWHCLALFGKTSIRIQRTYVCFRMLPKHSESVPDDF